MTTVAIFGGGVAGMSAAHMLARRGFEVTVYDRNDTYAGGKARSVDIPDTNTTDPDKYLPGEHGFRFFPGFYRHIIETLDEIPLPGGGVVSDNLVATETIQINQIGDCPIPLPLDVPKSRKDLEKLFDALREIDEEISRDEAKAFAGCVWQLMTSCQGRYDDEYEKIGWWEFTRADEFGEGYRRLLVDGLTRSLVAAKARLASTRTIGMMFTQLLYTLADGIEENTDRVLNAPTNEAWLHPWLTYLRSLGVDYQWGRELVRVEMESDEPGASIARARVREVGGGDASFDVEADHYVLAVPVEVAAEVVENSDGLVVADPALANVKRLAPHVEWMNGIQYFLTKPFNMHRGHTVFSGSNYALTSISQAQFWPGYDFSDRFDGRVKGILSVDISDWDKPGNFNGKPAAQCTPEEVIEEVWEQLKNEINTGCSGRDELHDDMLVFSYLADSIYQPVCEAKEAEEASCRLHVEKDEKRAICELENRDPLLVNVINTLRLRPSAGTRIPNLTLASDYVRTHSDLACMEGANEAARRAVNAILDSSGSDTERLGVWRFRSPFPLNFLQALDWVRWKLGLDWSGLFVWPWWNWKHRS